MKIINHYCEECDSEFTIKYDEEQCESDPLHCPFCSSYLFEIETKNDEDID